MKRGKEGVVKLAVTHDLNSVKAKVFCSKDREVVKPSIYSSMLNWLVNSSTCGVMEQLLHTNSY